VIEQINQIITAIDLVICKSYRKTSKKRRPATHGLTKVITNIRPPFWINQWGEQPWKLNQFVQPRWIWIWIDVHGMVWRAMDRKWERDEREGGDSAFLRHTVDPGSSWFPWRGPVGRVCFVLVAFFNYSYGNIMVGHYVSQPHPSDLVMVYLSELLMMRWRICFKIVWAGECGRGDKNWTELRSQRASQSTAEDTTKQFGSWYFQSGC
jgi:hypothetical protein